MMSRVHKARTSHADAIGAVAPPGPPRPRAALRLGTHPQLHTRGARGSVGPWTRRHQLSRTGADAGVSAWGAGTGVTALHPNSWHPSRHSGHMSRWREGRFNVRSHLEREVRHGHLHRFHRLHRHRRADPDDHGDPSGSVMNRACDTLARGLVGLIWGLDALVHPQVKR